MKRVNKVTQTSAMAIDVLAKSLPGKVYNLSAGDPDLPVCDALKKAYEDEDLTRSHNYGSSQGNKMLREKLWDNPDEVIFSNGAKQLIYMSLAAVARPGDEVVIIGPCWTSYMRVCGLLGLKYKLLIGDTDDFCPDIKDVAFAVTPQTAAVLINNPNNPTGYIYDSEYMNTLLDICRKNDCYLISDEIYRYLTDAEDGMRVSAQDTKSGGVTTFRGDPSVITIDGFSKCLNITGWRAGYAIATAEVIEAMTGIQSQMSGPPSTLIQSILLKAWDKLESSSYDDYRDRIDLLCDIEKFRKHRPQAGFYFYIPIDERWKDTEELCGYMLKEHNIAITPGDDYGAKRTVRVSVAAVGIEELREIKDILIEI